MIGESAGNLPLRKMPFCASRPHHLRVLHEPFFRKSSPFGHPAASTDFCLANGSSDFRSARRRRPEAIPQRPLIMIKFRPKAKKPVKAENLKTDSAPAAPLTPAQAEKTTDTKPKTN